MAKILEIAELGNPVLRKQADVIKNFADKELKALVEDMIVTVEDANGVGLAAPQVSKSMQLFLMCSYPNDRYPDAPEMETTVIINPEIISTSYDMELDWEGCLSIPGLRGLVPRFKSINVSYTDLSGKENKMTLEDFPARIFQHEYDHLKGIVFLDRMETNMDIITDNEYIKLMNEKIEHHNE